MASAQEWQQTSYLHVDAEEEEVEEEGEDEDEEEESSGSSNRPQPHKGRWLLAGFLDPRSKSVQEWNRVFLLVCAAGLTVDPLFFYALSISDTCMCLFIDGWFAITVTALRCMTDLMHLWNVWLQLKMAYGAHRARASGEEEGKVHARKLGTTLHYVKSMKGLFFDLFVLLPIPQI